MAPLVVALICSSAAGDLLARAKQQATQLDFTAALGTAREALEAGDAEPQETAAIHAFTGELAAALGDRELARGEFARALLLNPALDYPGASPRIREPFTEARKQVAGKTFSISAASTRAADGTVSTSVTWTGDLYSLAASGRVFIQRDGRWQKVEDAQRWSCLGGCRYWAAAVDSHGNQLARTGGPDAPFTMAALEKSEALASAPTEAVVERPRYQRPGPYLAAAAVAFVALSVYFGVRFQAEQNALLDLEAHRSEHTMAEAFALDSSRQRDRILMFVAIGATGVLGIVAAFTW